LPAMAISWTPSVASQAPTGDRGVAEYRLDTNRDRLFKRPTDHFLKLQNLASLPTSTPESAGLCALGLLGNLIPVTAHQ
jgi:hypothetical protein